MEHDDEPIYRHEVDILKTVILMNRFTSKNSEKHPPSMLQLYSQIG